MENLLEIESFEENREILRKLIKLRNKENPKLDQKYVTEDTILQRLAVIAQVGLLDEMRVLAIGDADLTGLGLSAIGLPSEVLIADIDRRLSEILFDANLDYNLPVRFLYHDMRIKMIEVLKSQFTLIIAEPPQTKAGVLVFLSRAIECIVKGINDAIFFSVPRSGEVRKYFEKIVEEMDMEIIGIHQINKYIGDFPDSDFLQLKTSRSTKVKHSGHWLKAFYEREETMVNQPFRCRCGEIFTLGVEFRDYDEMVEKGCWNCDNKEIFVFHSDVKME